MEGVLSQAFRIIGLPRRESAKSEAEIRNQQIIEDIADVRMQLKSAHCRFEHALDDEMVVSTIYEIESLESRYGYLLKQARARGILCAYQ